MKGDILNFISAFLKKLKAHKDFRVKNYRLTADFVDSLSLGQKDNELLGPYNMPVSSKSLGASMYIIWEDGMISNVNLNYDSMSGFASEIAGWRSSAYRDESAPEVWNEDRISQDDFSKYRMYDPEVAAIASGDATSLFEGIRLINGELTSLSKLISVSATAQVVRRMIFLGPEAAGPAFDFSFTVSAISFDLDNVYDDYFIKRRSFKEADLYKITEKARAIYPAFAKKLDKSDVIPTSGEHTIIFTPSTADSFVKKYIASNLYGRQVVEKQSKFSLSDFLSRESAFRDDISIGFLQNGDEYEINNIPLTYEGVYAEPSYFVKNGKLITPMLDLKYARKAEMQPNAYLTSDMFQCSDFSLRVETGEYEFVNNVIADMSEGFIIFGVLGLHTQDHTSGNFSVSSPYSLSIKDGKLDGLVKLSLSGNFFEILNHHNTKFLNWYSEGDSISLKCRCS